MDALAVSAVETVGSALGVGEGSRSRWRSARALGLGDGADGAAPGERAGGASDRVGLGEGAGEASARQTCSNRVAGGRGWLSPSSPSPHDQPSTSPASTSVLPAPTLDHVQPPCPSPRQYPQKRG